MKWSLKPLIFTQNAPKTNATVMKFDPKSEDNFREGTVKDTPLQNSVYNSQNPGQAKRVPQGPLLMKNDTRL